MPTYATAVSVTALFATAMMATVGSPESAHAQEEGQPAVFYAELKPGIGARAELAGGGGFTETVVYEIHFFAPSDSSEVEEVVLLTSDEEKTERVYVITAVDTSKTAVVERCRLKDRKVECRELDKDPIFFPDLSYFTERLDAHPNYSPVLEIEIPRQRLDWGSEFLRLGLEEGRYTLEGGRIEIDGDGNEIFVATEFRSGSPELMSVVLPALSDLERQYLEQRPFLRFDASPFVRDQRTGTGGFDEISVRFDGGIYRPSASGNLLFQLTWYGDVGTDSDVTFNRLSAEAGVAGNLIPKDWLPLTIVADVETDQDFDAVDLSAKANLAYVLPFNLNFQSGPYRPAASPLLGIVTSYGRSLARPKNIVGNGEEPTGAGVQEEGNFFRAGYQIRWRVPVARNALVRLHHAGLWNDAEDADGDWHFLWDVQLEIETAGVRYFIGYQEGEAAPLFEPIETTRVGLSFTIGAPGEG